MNAVFATLKFAIVFAVVAATALLGVYWHRESTTERFYNQASLGQSEARMLATLGAPDREFPCGEWLWWNGDTANPPKNDGRCAKWVRYDFPFGAYAFGYSHDGKLVSRYHYVSE